MSSPIISILVPVYNTEKYLRACLDSILAQTFIDFEAVLVDDGSTDNSGDICDEYAAKDSRFVVIHKKNEGVTKARVTAFEYSKGGYITFIDSDDYVANNYLEKLYEPVNKYQAEMVGCQFYLDFESKRIPVILPVKGLFESEQIKTLITQQYLFNKQTGDSGMTIFLCTKLIKRDYVLDGLNAGSGLWWGEDQIASFYIISRIKSLFVLSDCLYYYVKHEGQATQVYKSSLWDNQLNTYERYKEIDKEGLLKDQLPLRTWKYSIMINLNVKMPTTITNYSEFCKEMKRIDKNEAWIDLFNRMSIGYGWKNDIKFWILKLKLYRLFFFLFYKKQIQRIKIENKL